MTTTANSKFVRQPNAMRWAGASAAGQSAALLARAIHHASVLALGHSNPGCSITDEQFEDAIEFFEELVEQYKLLPEEDDDGEDNAT